MEPVYTLQGLLARHEYAARPAVVDGKRHVTYAELAERARALAGALRRAGVSRGDRVAIYLRRSLESVAAFFATQLVGGVAVIVNEKLRARQVGHIVSHSEAALLVTEGRLRERAAGLDVPVLDIDAPPAGDDAAPAPVVGADLAVIIYTSGSTGLPKGIMLSHANLVSGAETVADYLKLDASDRLISLLPFSFDYGLNQLLSAMLVGATLVIQRSMFPPDICRTLEREQITGMAGVPLLWSQLSQPYSPFTKIQLPRLRYMTNSGGVFPPHLIERFRRAHPQVDLYLMYGLTEAFRSTYLPPELVDTHPTSMGRAIPNVEILLVNDRGEACAPGETGELVHRGANVALGYWRDPEATRRVFRPHPFRDEPAETVVYSGDLVKRDADGLLYFVGRKDQMMKSQGYRVSPEEVEHYLRASGLVTEAVTFAVPAGDVGTDIIAAVTPADPATFDEPALREYCKDEMPEYMRPAVIWRMDTFPQTTSGKPDRPAIRTHYLAQ